MQIVNRTEAFNFPTPEPDNEWLHLDAEDVVASAVRLLRAVAREGLMYGELNRHGAVTGLAQDVRQYLATRTRFLQTETGREHLPSVTPTLLANASPEPMPMEAALDVVDVVL